ncbi:delta-12 fatty acid desaturase protein [Moniliophthora roreri]|uniref:Uncharacterized protein n=1 Tax=Moniliophthora roreri TaxID=221103 RepID=A0A0W0F6Q8_MONRR|nr:delta-12 fatty acid desaturase protein [Moniliophthora roreri]
MPGHTASLLYQDVVDQSQDRAPVTPVHCLPPEILGIIFAMFNDIDDTQWLQPSDAELAPALAISRTCKRWREISLSLPFVWSFLAIRFLEWDLPDYRQLILLTRLFTDRSKTHPLTLNLDFNKFLSINGEEDTIVPILRILVQHSERWHTVQLHSITRAVISHRVFSPISGRLPILTNLALYGGDEEEEDGPLDFSCDLFSNCPSLTSVSCEPGGPLAVPLTKHSPLAWGQIKSLDIYNAEISHALRVASFGTNLEQLAIYYCSGEPYTGGYFSVPGVTHLSICVVDSAEEAYCPFKYLTLQRLSSLDISRVFGYDEEKAWNNWDEQHILGFLNRSGCTLTLLSLRGVPISDEQLIQLLRLTPALSSLRIVESYWSDHTNWTITQRFLQKLTIDDKSPPFLPKLTDISLVLCEDGLAATVLPNALISRWIPDDSQFKVACIKSVDVVFINESEETIEVLTSKLRFLREEGVWVTVERVQVVAEEEL